MAQATAVLGHVDAAGFALIGILALVTWMRQRGRARACLAAALGLLGLVSVVDEVTAVVHVPAAISVLVLVCFMGSGYALVELRHTVLPLRRTARAAVLATLGVTTLLAVPLTAATPSATPNRYAWLVGSALILEWAACIIEPAVRFRFAARGRPVVQRMRLRALSTGYLAIAIALLLALGSAVIAAAVSSRPNPIVGIGFQVIATLAIPLFYVGFAPPRWVRRSWRAREADAYRNANDALLTFADDQRAMADRSVEWAMRFVGADAGVLLAHDGTLLASRDLAGGELENLAERARRHQLHGAALLDGTIAVVPVPTSQGPARLAVVAGGDSPLFGGDELRTLSDFASSVAIALDRVRLSEELRHQTGRMRSLLGAVSDLGAGLIITEAGRLVFANDAYLEMSGYGFEELENKNLIELAPRDDRDALVERLQARLAGKSVPVRYEARLLRKDESILDVEAVVHTLPGAAQPARLISLIQDISARKRAEGALAEAARLDPLTAVPNRRAWAEQLAATLAHAARHNEPLAVALLDLDGFKEFNDDWGHQRGDELLVAVAQAWKAQLRDEDFLARYGGDEFSVIMPACTARDAVSVLRRMTESSPERASAGVAAWDGNETGDELMARADGALLRAKKERRGNVVIASRRASDRASGWKDQLDRLLEHRYLRSAYQPIVCLDTGAVLGHEALLRLNGTPANTSVEDLFSAAQRLGYSRDLDWVSRRAALEGSRNLPPGQLLFVNVSARALLDPIHGSDQMLMLLRWSSRDPAEVVLEISEREVINDLPRLYSVLAEYRAHGFRFALDDVGEGHSTLEVLAAADAEFIKIARSLTEGLREPGPRAAVRAIVTFAESSGATLVAEGMSSQSMIDETRNLGIRYGQGYALGRPQFIDAPAVEPAALEAV